MRKIIAKGAAILNEAMAPTSFRKIHDCGSKAHATVAGDSIE